VEVGRHPTNSWQHVAIVNIPSCKYQLNPLYISLTIRNFIFGLHYFTAQGSQVYCVSLDASKAFDRVLHSGLFMKLANRGISLSFIKLLKYWYSHLQCAVLWKGVLGNIFNIARGVRQGGVLSPFLFAIYMAELIGQLSSGYGLYVGNLFMGCIMYADDIMLLSCSCYGLQKLVDICEHYGEKWDIIFNPKKTQCVSFGGKTPEKCGILLNGSKLEWVAKLTYLGCHFVSSSCKVDFSTNIRKFYGSFNNILSVLGKNRHEISCVHLVKSYCVPSLAYGCEIWNLSCVEYLHMNVLWNNTFRKIFNCCWRESTKQLLFYCEVVPMSYIIDQHTILFYKRLQTSENKVVRVLARINRDSVGAILSKYGFHSLQNSVFDIKEMMWAEFTRNVGL